MCVSRKNKSSFGRRSERTVHRKRRRERFCFIPMKVGVLVGLVLWRMQHHWIKYRGCIWKLHRVRRRAYWKTTRKRVLVEAVATGRTEGFDDLWVDETTFFGLSDSRLGQVDVETEVCQNSHDIFNVSNESCSFENVDGDCKKSEQHLGSTWEFCRFGGDERDAAVKWGLATFCAVVAVSGESRWERIEQISSQT